MNPKLLRALTVGVLGLSAVFVSTEPTRADVIDPTVFSPTALDFGPVALNQSVTLPLNVSVNLNSFEPGLIVNDLVASITGANFTFIADPSNVQPCFNLDGGCIYHITFTQKGTNMQGLLRYRLFLSRSVVARSQYSVGHGRGQSHCFSCLRDLRNPAPRRTPSFRNWPRRVRAA